MATKKAVEVRAVTTWRDMVALLHECKTDHEVQGLMDIEKKGDNRIKFLMRMQGRMTVLRRRREAQELEG